MLSIQNCVYFHFGILASKLKSLGKPLEGRLLRGRAILFGGPCVEPSKFVKVAG